MTENEAKERCDLLINSLSVNNGVESAFCDDLKGYVTFTTMRGFAQTCKKALKEVQQYRAIGTPEECRAAVEKQTTIEPIRIDKCTCPSCGTYNEVWKKRRNTLPSDIVYCWHCGQAVEIKRSDE